MNKIKEKIPLCIIILLCLIIASLIYSLFYFNTQKNIKINTLQSNIYENLENIEELSLDSDKKTTIISEYENKIIDLEQQCQTLQSDITDYQSQNDELLEIINSYEVPSVKVYTVSSDSNFKAYMSYKAVTNTSSAQYALLNSEYASTDETNGLRTFNNRYCIAVGSGWGASVGDYLDLILANGTVINCVIGDMKSNVHTDSTNKICLSNGSIAEFIVDYSIFYDFQDGSGTVNYVDGFNSKIVQIIVY